MYKVVNTMDKKRISLIAGFTVLALMLLCACGTWKAASASAEHSKADSSAELSAQESEAPGQSIAEVTEMPAPTEVTSEPLESAKPPETSEFPAQEMVVDDLVYDQDIPVPEVFIHRFKCVRVQDDSRKTLISAFYDMPALGQSSAVDYPELAAVLEHWGEEMEQEFNTQLDDKVPDAEEILDQDPDRLPFEMESELIVRRSDRAALSMLRSYYTYLGGPHGYKRYSARSFSPVTGEEILLSDVVLDESRFRSLLSDGLLEKYDTDAFPDLESKLDDMVLEDFVFTLDADTITLWFGEDTVGPYSSGPMQLSLRYREYEDLFPAWLTTAVENYSLPFDLNQELSLPDQSGQEHVLSVRPGDGDDYGKSFVISYADEEYTEFYNPIQDMDPLLMCLDGNRYFLLVDAEVESAYHFMFIYRLDEDGIHTVDTLMPMEIMDLYVYHSTDSPHYIRNTPADPTSFLLQTSSDLLSTNQAVGRYRLLSDGTPELINDWLEIPDGNSITLKVNLELPIVDSDTGQRTGGSEALPAGTELKLCRTDLTGYVDLETEGKLYRVYVETGDNKYQQTIDGRPIEEYFDGIILAG